MQDPTFTRERMALTAETNAQVISNNPEIEKLRLQVQYGDNNVWDTSELSRDFRVVGFLAPFCCVERKSDGVKGAVMFQHSPRFYFDFQPA